ncbi:MAG: LCP family protein [Candidatus Moraniibacteriota bacterium]|nr:MAG: LCP family protein [Candidatus Moranbacteria bacterium]
MPIFGQQQDTFERLQQHPQHHRKFLRIFLWTLPLLLLVTLSLLTYFSWKIGSATRAMSIDPQEDTALSDTLHGATSLLTPILHRERSLLPGESEGRTNILLLGKANEKTAGQNLTDTIMVASFDFSRKKIALLSLPRDLYVEIPDTKTFTKLNALYQIDRANNESADTIKQAVSTITGLPIHAFATLDYDGFINIIDRVGGISIYVERDLFDSRFPGPNYSYETFSVKKGWQDLDGATTLKYVRERHGDPEGDFGRAKRQQAVLAALKKKAFSLQIFLNPLAISGVIDTLGNHIKTDLSLANIESLIGLADEFDTTNISTAVIDAWKKDSLLRVSHVPVGSVSMFILVPRTGDWVETRELAQNIFDLDQLRSRQESIDTENARITLVNNSDNPSLGARVMQFLTENLHMKQVRIAPKVQSTEYSMSENNTLDTSRIFRRASTEAVYTTNEIAMKLSLQTGSQDDTIHDIFKEYDQSDIVVFLGNDLAKRLSFKEDTIDDLQSSEKDLEYQKQLDAALASER